MVIDAPSGPIPARLWDATGANLSVLLVPGQAQELAGWDNFAEALQTNGTRALAVNGMDVGQAATVRFLLQYLAGLGAPRLAAVGASVGAEAVLAAASKERCAGGVAELSPMPDADPTRPKQVLQDFGMRPLFIGVGAKDVLAYAAAQEHRSLAQGTVTYAEATAGSHGTELLDEPSVRAPLDRWIAQVPQPCGT